MIRSMGLRCSAFFRAVMPDPFVLAIGLTLVVFALAAALEGKGPADILDAWQGSRGFWSLLRFGMQMVLILVTGHALASTPPVARGIRALARLPRTAAQAAALVSTIAIFASVLNWGLGLIVGALLAREAGLSCLRRGIRHHYPVLAAAGYSGLVTWHGGLSGSAPLKVTTREGLVEMLGPELGNQVAPMPFTETVLGSMNLLITGGLWLLVPLVCAAMMPTDSDPQEGVDQFSPGKTFAPDPGTLDSLPDRIETSRWLVWLIALPLLASIWRWLEVSGIQQLNPNSLNLVFLALGLILHGSVRRYQQALGDAISGTTGIVLQFPFYAGIMGVMYGSGLAERLSGLVSDLASPKLFALVTFMSAGLINLFVPSGGGQWAVQGPISIGAATDLGLDPSLAVMAVAYGDQWTNMLQPFWALPLLGITGVKARDLIGYTAIVLVAAGLWMGGCLVLLSP